MTNITVIGAGEVFWNRYLKAASIVGKEYCFNISDIVDIRPPSAILAETDINQFDTTIYAHQLLDQTPDGLIRLLEYKDLSSHPVIIATPTLTHVPYASALLKHGMTVCVEKPLAANREHIDQFDKVVKELGTDRLFLLGYYALEKGLAALVLANSGNVPKPYLNLLEPSVEPHLIGEIRASLGKVRYIRAVLLEGAGTAGRLNQRSWVLDQKSGGNTVETFYHLICMVIPFFGNGNQVKISHAELARHRATDQWFCKESGEQSAEALTAVHLSTDDAVEARLICAKYVPENLHERWMEIEFENGRVFADFEQGTLSIEGRDMQLSFALRHKTKYSTQLTLFAEKLHTPNLRTEYRLFRDALLLTLEIRQQGIENGLYCYDTEDITREWLNKMLGL
jgi:predicted dehydrogenase